MTTIKPWRWAMREVGRKAGGLWNVFDTKSRANFCAELLRNKGIDAEAVPVYGPEALDAAVAAERDKWRILTDESSHIFNGGCPEHGKWNSRDPECPACVALGDWLAP
jgi:hypothetical protein